MHERRKSPRIGKQTIVAYDLLDEEEIILDAGVGKTLDLSEKGLHLELPRNTRKGDRVKLTVNIDGSLIDLFAIVAWALPKDDHCEAGLMLEHYPEEYATYFESLL